MTNMASSPLSSSTGTIGSSGRYCARPGPPRAQRVQPTFADLSARSAGIGPRQRFCYAPTVTIARHRFWICVTGSGCAMSSVSPRTVVWRRTSCLWRRQPRRDTPAIQARSCAASKPSPMLPGPVLPGPGQNPAGSLPGSRSAQRDGTHATSSPILRVAVASIFKKKSTPPEARPRTTSRRGRPISRPTGRRAQKPTPIRCA